MEEQEKSNKKWNVLSFIMATIIGVAMCSVPYAIMSIPEDETVKSFALIIALLVFLPYMALNIIHHFFERVK